MLTILDNIYNSRVGRDKPKFKLWRSAGLIITFRCSAACRFCYYHCSPAPSPVMPVETAITAWQGLKQIAGEQARVHLTGGEAFLEWERLEQIVRQAKRLKLGPIEQIETNASWAVSEGVIKQRLAILNDCGMQVLKISCDPFHQEFVDIEKVRFLASVAENFLGKNRVLVRWEKYLNTQFDTRERDSVHLESMKEFPIRFTGRAGGELAELTANKAIEDICNRNCTGSFMNAKGVHIDPLGNVFSGVCSGIIIGNINSQPLESIWKQIGCHEDTLVGILLSSGPAGLLENAVKAGYIKRRFYSSGCHLCTDIRQYYHNKGLHKSIIGPDYCYADGAARKL